MTNDKPDDPIIKYVAERRARTGRKFETCETMKPVFAELDAAGWNDWPPAKEKKDEAPTMTNDDKPDDGKYVIREVGERRPVISLHYEGPVDLDQPLWLDQIRRKVQDCVREMREFPNVREGAITLDGVEHFFTCAAVSAETVEMNVVQRDEAEARLNVQGLSTHEKGNPMPGRRDKRWGKPK